MLFTYREAAKNCSVHVPLVRCECAFSTVLYYPDFHEMVAVCVSVNTKNSTDLLSSVTFLFPFAKVRALDRGDVCNLPSTNSLWVELPPQPR